MKHPQLPQHPQHPRPAANENASRVYLLDFISGPHQAEARNPQTDLVETTSPDHLPSFSSKRPHRDYFSGSPYRAINKNTSLTDPPREAISLSQCSCHKETDPSQTPPRAALPDSVIDVGLDPPEAASTSRIPCEDRPPVILEISGTPEPEEELSESRQCPDMPGKWF